MLRVIDTETTSLEGGIVEIASVDIVEGKICNPMSDFVRPPEPISFEAMAIHHITEEMVADAPPITDVIGRYLGAGAYVAHNAVFDKCKLPQISAPWICTLKLARKLFPDFERHGNQYLRYRLGLKPFLPEGLYAHRALYDCYVTAELLMYMGREAQWTVGEMREISSSPSLLIRLPYGKHKGETFENIARTNKGYLTWLMATNLDEDMRFTVTHWLDQR